MKVKNNILVSILLSFITLFSFTQAFAKDCQKDMVIIQDKATGYIINCMTGKRIDDLEKRLTQLDESMKLYFDQILATSNQIVKKIEKVDKNQLKSEKFLISMREKILDATELAKTDKGAAIEKLAIESIQTNRKLENTVNAENNKLSPELVDALSNFNFARANEILDSLNRIEDTVNRVETKVDKTNSYISKTQDFQLIENAISSRAMTDTGHVAAFQRFVNDGGGFSGRDLSGLALNGGNLDGIKLDSASLALSNISKSKFRNSDFSNSRMLSMEAEDSDFSNSNLSKSYGEAINFKGSNFRNAKINMASWAMSDLQKADFSGADLSNSSFLLSDLRGANFKNADLTNTFFGNTDLRYANFEGAKFSNTDFSGAILGNNSTLLKNKSGKCATLIAYINDIRQGVTIDFVEPIPSSYYSSGYTYDRNFVGRILISVNQIGDLPQCDLSRSVKWENENWKYKPTYTSERHGTFVGFENSIGFQYEHALLKSAGRKEVLKNRLKKWQFNLNERARVGINGCESNKVCSVDKNNKKDCRIEHSCSQPNEKFLEELSKW